MAMKQYKIISDRWASEEVVATFAEIQEQAEYLNADRRASGEIEHRGPVMVSEQRINGNAVVVDDTGEIIAEEITSGRGETKHDQ